MNNKIQGVTQINPHNFSSTPSKIIPENIKNQHVAKETTRVDMEPEKPSDWSQAKIKALFY